ncbi:MAG: hypothetical protein LBC56_00335 [Oscillospiraceae bacterium]|jgi:hypothetical protein|nr:hypothetical protein [Oscillospiraceae bacterium]
MKIKKNKLLIVNLVSLCLVILGTFIPSLIRSGGGTAAVNKISLSEETKVISALLYIPRDISSDQPAPAALIVPDFNAEASWRENAALELAAKGYVVMSLDTYGQRWSSSGTSAPKDGGVYAAVQYLGTLSIVDNAKIGVLASGLGEMQAIAAVERASGEGGVKPKEIFSSQSIADIINDFRSLDEGAAPAEKLPFGWLWREIFAGLGFAGFFTFLISFALLLLGTSFFAGFARPEPHSPAYPRKTGNKILYVLIIILLFLIPAVLYNWAMGVPVDFRTANVQESYPLTASLLLPSPAANGYLLFAAAAAVLSIALFCLAYSLGMKKHGANFGNIGLKLSPASVGKSALLGFAVFAAGYLLLALCEFFFGTGIVFLNFSLETLSPARSGMWLVYAVLFAPSALAEGLVLNNFVRRRLASEKFSMFMIILINCGGLLLLCLANYISLAATGTKLLPESLIAGTSTAVSDPLLARFIPVLAFNAVSARLLFRKTGTVWAGSFLNAFVLALFALSSTGVI